MTLIRWKPTRSANALQEEMNRVFDSFFNYPMRRSENVSGWMPDVDVIEDKDGIKFMVDLPGMEKDDIKVSVENNTLTIKGERKGHKEEEDKNYHMIERTYGTFTRSFSLPSKVDGQKIKANYKNGVLSIDLPKVEEEKPKEIPINVA